MYNVNAKVVKQAIRRFGKNHNAVMTLKSGYIQVIANHENDGAVTMTGGSGEGVALDYVSIQNAIKSFDDTDLISIDAAGNIENADHTARATAVAITSDVRRASMLTGETVQMFYDATEFKRILTNAISHAARMDVRFYLNGALINVNGTTNRVQIVATDGHRLYNETLPGQAIPNIDKDVNFIIPNDALNQVKRSMVSNKSKNVAIELQVDGQHGQIRFDDGSMIDFKSIDGKFPEYGRVIPGLTDRSRFVTLDRKLTIDRLTKLYKVSNKSKYGLALVTVNGAVQIDHKSDNGEASARIDYNERDPGDDYECGLNVGYMLDAVKAMQGETVSFNFCQKQSDKSSVLVTDTYNGLAVVMPARL